jgi:F0F1-type ATP synthase membrane subunit b/b'
VESEFIAQLLDLGITGLFITYLVWANKIQTKRLDEYVARLLTTLATLEDEREKGFDKVRDRYDEVVDRYNTERDKLLNDIIVKLEEALRLIHQKNEEDRLARLTRRPGSSK